MTEQQQEISPMEKLYQMWALDDDARPVCEKCGSPKYTIQGKGIAGIMRDYVIPAPCDCEDEETERKQRESDEAVARNEDFGRQTYIASLRDSGLKDSKQRGYTFAKDDDPTSAASITCRKYVKQWEKFRRTNNGIMLYGSVGTGKTYLACCIANALIDEGVGAKVRKLSAMLNASTFKEREQELNYLADVDLLIIDDLGMERATEYAQELVFTLIDDRMNSNRPLIITTNLSPKQMADTESLPLKRIYDRVLQQCPIQLRLTGESRRHQDRDKRMQDINEILFGEGD